MPNAVSISDLIPLVNGGKIDPEELKKGRYGPEEIVFNYLGHPVPNVPSRDLSGIIHTLNHCDTFEYYDAVILSKYQAYFKTAAEAFLESNEQGTPLYNMVEKLHQKMFDEDKNIKLWSDKDTAREFFQFYQELSKTYWIKKTADMLIEKRKKQRDLIKNTDPDMITTVDFLA